MKYIDEYLEYLEYQKKYSNNTIVSYRQVLFAFNDYLDEKNINILKIEYDEIKNYLKYLNGLKLSNTSICKYISSLKGFYKYLTKNKYIASSPLILISLPKKEKKLPKFLYYNELEDMFKVPDLNNKLGIRNRFIIELFYATGIRVSELVNIKIDDINYKNCTIKIMGKGSKERIVFYGDYAHDYLNLYLKDSRPLLLKGNSDYLFLSNLGKQISVREVQVIIGDVIKQTSIKTKASPHTIRHSFATHLLNEGCDILTVKELLGHESLKATQIYTHVTNERLKEVYFSAHPCSKKTPK